MNTTTSPFLCRSRAVGVNPRKKRARRCCQGPASAVRLPNPKKFLRRGGLHEEHEEVAHAAAIVVASIAIPVPAFAGEIAGNDAPTRRPAHANSICVFSGRNDDPAAPIISANPIPEAPNGPGGRTQSYGQDVRYGLLNPRIVTPASRA
jgi:hypothetical protein